MNNRGIALVISYMVIAVLTILSAAFLAQSISEKKITDNYSNSTRALWLAEAGIQQGLWELNQNNCAGCLQCGTVTSCTNCICSGANKCIAGSLTTGDYDTTIASGNTNIISIGSFPSRGGANRVQRSVRVDLITGSFFNHAVFVRTNLGISNNALVNSYNSSNGSYGGTNIGANGDVGTNSTSNGAITIGNNADVHGDVSTGGGTVSVGRNATVTGSTTYDNNVNLSAVVVPSSLTSLISGGAYTVPNNGSKTIYSGDYQYSSISISNNGSLTISGTVNLYLTSASSLTTSNNADIIITAGSKLTVYVDGVANISNNATVNNVSRIPASFQLYSTYTGANGVDISNNGALYGAIYAPETNVTINNNAGLYGAVVGDSVSLINNGDIHYDEALRNISGSASGFTLDNWQEI